MRTTHAGWIVFGIFALASAIVMGQSFVVPSGGGTGGAATNAVTTVSSNGVSITTAATSINFVQGTNVVLTSTNAGGAVSIGIHAAAAAGSGEVNVIGDAGLTNATRISQSFDKLGVTNRLKTVSAGNGIVQTNEGTNIVTAVDPAVVPSHAQLVTVSNNVPVIFSPTLSNATIKPLVVGVAAAAGATNTTGQIRGIEAGGNVTITPNGSNYVIAASVSGSGITTNGTQFGPSVEVTIASGVMLTNLDVINLTNRGISRFTGVATFNAAVTNNDRVWLNERINQNDTTLAATFGQLRSSTLIVTQSFRLMATNLAFPSGTNLIADGNMANVFTNVIDGRTAGITNIVVTNILDGQTILLGLYVTNGITVQLCTAPAVQIPAPWYTDGVAIQINTNGFTWVEIKRYGNWTNVTQVLTPSFGFAPGPQLSFATDFVTRTNTILLSAALTNLSGVSQYFTNGQASSMVLSNLVGTVANNVTNENSTALQINTGTLTLSPGNVSNLVNNTTIDFQAGNIVTNVIAMKWNIWTNYVQTVSNLVFSFNTNRYELKNQTNVIFTNIVEEATAVGADMAVHIHNTTGVTMGLVWPAYGAQHGYFFQTNINNPILSTTTLTTGKHGVASFTAFGTNIFATWTEWP